MLYYSNYFKLAHGNFGDDLNPWLWSRLAPEVCDQRDPALFLAIGTILSRSVPMAPVKVVFGSGCGSNRPPAIDHRWFIYCVRGPLTAAKLKIDPALAVVDPAVLVRRINLPSLQKTFPISFMPHHQSMPQADWVDLCQRVGIHCIDPRNSADQVLSEVLQTGLLIAEAMHGAIVADALRVPWIPVRLYGNFMEFKWQDWTQSIDVPLHIVSIPPLFERETLSRKGAVDAFKKVAAAAGVGKEKWKRLRVRPSTQAEIEESLCALGKLAKSQTPCLSSDEKIAQLEARLFEKLGQLREDWKRGKFKTAVQNQASPSVASP